MPPQFPLETPDSPAARAMAPRARRQAAALPSLSVPTTLDAALSALMTGGDGARLVAGATWIMRGQTRGEAPPRYMIALNRIPELHGVEITSRSCRIGAMASHQDIAGAIADTAPDCPDLAGLFAAAGQSANPGIRRLATLGGNLCATGFQAADLVPALLALDAEVGVLGAEGRVTMPLGDFVLRRREPAPFIATHVTFSRSGCRAAHSRTPMRDYPVAIASLSLATGAGRRITEIRLGVGAVERDPRRWHAFEEAALGALADPIAMADLARQLSTGFSPMSALDAPGWYRLEVLPTLVRRAFQSLCDEEV